MFGLQYMMMRYLSGVRVTPDNIAEGREYAIAQFGTDRYFNAAMWQHIVDAHGGRLPLEIKAVPEGTAIPVSNVMLTVVNTDPVCYQLTNHTETLLSQLWYPSTVASLSHEVYKMLHHYWTATCDSLDGIQFGLHDFGYRGATSQESAALGGAGHLLTFHGTDTIIGMKLARKFYAASLNPSDLLGLSVAATEHSVMTSWGESREEELFTRLLKKYPEGILSVVIDSYDYRRFVQTYAKNQKLMILARNGQVVFRPDSGDPISVTLDVIESLAAIFGYTTNNKGYKVLNPKVGVLWGDGLNYLKIRDILHAMQAAGWAASNFVFGMGGGLLQKVDRDVQRFAFKCSAQDRNNIWYDIQKNPLDTTKKSKAGRLKLELTKEGGLWRTVRIEDGDPNQPDMLRTCFRDGLILELDPFWQLQARLARAA
jgi:nicotinamide phosphoribosyltransferase